MAERELATTLFADRNSQPIQVLIGSGNRRMLTAGATTSNAAVPVGTSKMVIVRCTDYFYLNFGTSGSVTAVGDATSILVAPGEAPYPVPVGSTHFAGLRVGSTDVIVQLESIS